MIKTIVGVAIWSIIPGRMAKKRGRSFWGYYFLSYLISPLITMIVLACMGNKNKTEPEEVVEDAKEE